MRPQIVSGKGNYSAYLVPVCRDALRAHTRQSIEHRGLEGRLGNFGVQHDGETKTHTSPRLLKSSAEAE